MAQVVCYETFSSIDEEARRVILSNLGAKGGLMRRLAKKHDAKCAVVFDCQTPIGWATIFRPRKSKPREWELNIFIAPKHRRHGLGTNLMQCLMEHAGAYNGKELHVFPFNEGGRKFFRTIKGKKLYIGKSWR